MQIQGRNYSVYEKTLPFQIVVIWQHLLLPINDPQKTKGPVHIGN